MSGRENTKPDYSEFTRDSYGRMISTPSRDHLFVERYIIRGLLEEELQAGPGNRIVRVFDVACGYSHECEHFSGLPREAAERVHITGLDISGETLETAQEYFEANHPELNKRMRFIRGDVAEPVPELQEGTFDVAMGINAMAYVPAHMLDAIYRALKAGGKAVVNFMVTNKNPGYTEYYRSKGMVTSDQMYEVQRDLSIFCAPMMQHDHSGNESAEMARLGRQSFFYTADAAKSLLEFLGFEICGHDEYCFPSMASRNNIHDIFTIRKPLSAPAKEEKIRACEKILHQMVGGSVEEISGRVRKRIREKAGDHKDAFIETAAPEFKK